MRLSALALALSVSVAGAFAPLAAQDMQDSNPFPDPGQAVIRAGDALDLQVWPDSALSGRFSVDETGQVWLPGLGAVEVGGRPLTEVRDDLRRRYSEVMRIPVVEIVPRFRVGVIGAVQRPGLYTMDPTNTLFDAISQAGGFDDNAAEDEIRIIRDGVVRRINAEEALESGQALLALQLRSGDRIVVPEGRSWDIRDIFYGLQSVALIITLLTR